MSKPELENLARIGKLAANLPVSETIQQALKFYPRLDRKNRHNPEGIIKTGIDGME